MVIDVVDQHFNVELVPIKNLITIGDGSWNRISGGTDWRIHLGLLWRGFVVSILATFPGFFSILIQTQRYLDHFQQTSEPNNVVWKPNGHGWSQYRSHESGGQGSEGRRPGSKMVGALSSPFSAGDIHPPFPTSIFASAPVRLERLHQPSLPSHRSGCSISRYLPSVPPSSSGASSAAHSPSSERRREGKGRLKAPIADPLLPLLPRLLPSLLNSAPSSVNSNTCRHLQSDSRITAGLTFCWHRDFDFDTDSVLNCWQSECFIAGYICLMCLLIQWQDGKVMGTVVLHP